jgi:hypothetical protein
VSLRQPKDEAERWVALCLMMLAIWLAALVLMAVIPSWWLYFWDSVLKKTGTFTLPVGIRTLTLPWQAVRDLIVVIWYGGALAASGLAIRAYNRRNSKVLPADEPKREATGGYK